MGARPPALDVTVQDNSIQLGNGGQWRASCQRCCARAWRRAELRPSARLQHTGGHSRAARLQRRLSQSRRWSQRATLRDGRGSWEPSALIGRASWPLQANAAPHRGMAGHKRHAALQCAPCAPALARHTSALRHARALSQECLAGGRRGEVEQVFSTPLLELVFHAASVHRMYNDPQMVRPAPPPPPRLCVACVPPLLCC